MPTEVFVRTWSAPEAFRSHERTSSPAGSGAAAVRSAGRPRRQMLSTSSTAFPTASQVASRSLHTSGGDRPTSWTTSKGNWIHRSSPTPYQDDVSMKQRRLPKVLLARLGGWRPSTAAGKGAEPATMPVLFPLKPQFRPGRGAEQELDQRLEALREIFAEASPQSSREWTMPARLEELAKPRMQQVPKGLVFRECATPPEALLKKKRRPMHIPMSPKERLAASGGGNRGDLLSDLDQLDRMLARYDSNSTESASEPSTPVASPQSKRRPQPADKRSKPSKAAEVPKTTKAKAKARSKRGIAPSSPEPLVDEAVQEADVGPFSEHEDEEPPMDEEPPTDEEDEAVARRPVAGETLHYYDGSPIEAEQDTAAQSDMSAESELAESDPADAESEAAESASAAGSNAGVSAADAESPGRLSAASRDDLVPAASDEAGFDEANPSERVSGTGIAPAADRPPSADESERQLTDDSKLKSPTGLAESYSGFEEGDSKPATPAALEGQGTTPVRQASNKESGDREAAALDQVKEDLADAGERKEADAQPSFLRPVFVPAGEYPDDAEAAALKIQSLHRGRQARKRVSQYRDTPNKQISGGLDYGEDTAAKHSGLASASKLPATASPQSNEILPGQVDEVPRRIPRNVKLPELPLEQRQHVAALQIQTQYRGRLGRRKFAKIKAAKDETSPSRRTKSKESKSDDGYSEEFGESFEED